MKLFAISDLHLSFARPKPMERFGNNWKDHFNKIRDNWLALVDESDYVLIPGDISWALKYEDAMPDINFIADLPGRKIIIRGNHDYWWQSIKKIREDVSENMHFIQNDMIELRDVVISGTRLWNYPFINWSSAKGFDVEMNATIAEKQVFNHVKIRHREIERLKLCLSKIHECAGKLKIFMTHFPPIGSTFEPNEISKLLSENRIDICIFGHLHYLPNSKPVDQTVDEVRYILTSCDHLDFKLKMIYEI